MKTRHASHMRGFAKARQTSRECLPCCCIEILETRTLLADVSLVKDINTLTLNSNPVGIMVGGTYFFRADDGDTGRELWRSDGTATGTVLVKDIFPGTSTIFVGNNSSDPANFVEVGGTLYFTANDGVSGVEVWKSDGTAAGTVLVSDIRPGPNGSFPANLTNVGGTLYFTANDGLTGNEIWKSDGTAAGTTLVKDIRTDTFFGSNPANLTNLAGTLYFSADDGVVGSELWRSDGTAAGTTLVRDIRPGSLGSTPLNFREFGGTLFFAANDGANGLELWRSDGTAAGTTMVINLTTGSSSPSNLTSVAGSLFFTATQSGIGTELFRTDGTAAGTALVRDIRAGTLSSSPTLLTAVGSKLFFRATDGTGDLELWASDGTLAGTNRAKDIRPGSATSSPANLTDVGGTLYFSADDGISGTELWKSDGTEAGTVMVDDIQGGSLGSSPVSLVNAAGALLYFTANDGLTGTELWRSDGTAAGTFQVSDINTDTDGSLPFELEVVNDTLFFVASDGNTSGLWKSDGTESGTVLVKDVFAQNLTAVDDTLFFTLGADLWKSDGTTAGTVFVKAVDSFIGQLFAVDGTLFFAGGSAFGSGLWKSDGTAAGTLLVKPFHQLFGPTPVSFDGKLYFTANDGVHGNEVWLSDGTAAGTVMLKDMVPVNNNSFPQSIAVVNGELYISVINANFDGYDLWKSDGSTAGTVLVSDVFPSSGGSAPGNFTGFGGRVFFTAGDGVNGRELWTTDGTAAGTVMFKDINAGPASSNPFGLLEYAGALYFVANDGVHGEELWRSDGTASGTTLLKDIRLGASSSMQFSQGALPVVVGNTICFVATDSTGNELWTSDGTAAGTMQLADLLPGNHSSSPQELTPSGATLFFHADDGEHGRELWKLSFNAAPTAIANGPYAVGEGGAILLSAAGSSDPDQDASTLIYEWDLDGDNIFGETGIDAANGDETGSSPNFSAAGIDGPATVNITLRVTDSFGASDDAMAQIDVSNVAPAVGAITAPVDPQMVGASINVSAGFTDAGALDTHTAVWDWGDSTTSAGSVVEANGAGTVSGSHIFSAAGVYTVTLTVTDDDGGSNQSIFQYIVIYNPAAGFVTGGGTIDSPAGALVGNPTATGMAHFAFVSKYQNGAHVPTGQTRFRFNVGNFQFESTSYDWMVISGAKARYRGTGTVNGVGNFGFQITIIDGDRPGGGGIDRFRIRIWSTSSNTVVYDNQLGSSDDDDPVTALRGGSIRIQS